MIVNHSITSPFGQLERVPQGASQEETLSLDGEGACFLYGLGLLLFLGRFRRQFEVEERRCDIVGRRRGCRRRGFLGEHLDNREFVKSAHDGTAALPLAHKGLPHVGFEQALAAGIDGGIRGEIFLLGPIHQHQLSLPGLAINTENRLASGWRCSRERSPRR